MVNEIYPGKIAEELFSRMKLCKTREQMESIWQNFKNNEKDTVVINAVEEYLLKYKSYYFYFSQNSISGCIEERILGEF